jgi:hypothetical protein
MEDEGLADSKGIGNFPWLVVQTCIHKIQPVELFKQVV